MSVTLSFQCPPAGTHWFRTGSSPIHKFNKNETITPLKHYVFKALTSFIWRIVHGLVWRIRTFTYTKRSPLPHYLPPPVIAIGGPSNNWLISSPPNTQNLRRLLVETFQLKSLHPALQRSSPTSSYKNISLIKADAQMELKYRPCRRISSSPTAQSARKQCLAHSLCLQYARCGVVRFAQ